MFVFRTPVRFADVDHAGIVYYPVFYHYFHLAFEEFFRDRLGAKGYVDLLDRERIGFPAVATECQFFSPLRFGDDASIELALEKLGEKSVTFGYTVQRLPGQAIAARGRVVCAVTNLDSFRAVELPPKLRDLFATLREPAQS